MFAYEKTNMPFYDEGYDAYMDGHSSSSNPYNIDTENEKYWAWGQGYGDALDGDSFENNYIDDPD